MYRDPDCPVRSLRVIQSIEVAVPRDAQFSPRTVPVRSSRQPHPPLSTCLLRAYAVAGPPPCDRRS